MFSLRRDNKYVSTADYIGKISVHKLCDETRTISDNPFELGYNNSFEVHFAWKMKFLAFEPMLIRINRQKRCKPPSVNRHYLNTLLAEMIHVKKVFVFFYQFMYFASQTLTVLSILLPTFQFILSLFDICSCQCR